MLQRSNGRLVRSDTVKTKGEFDILVLEFDVEPSPEVPERTRALYAFREAPDHKSAVEIHCAFAEKQATLGRQVFGDALKSLTEEKKPSLESSSSRHSAMRAAVRLRAIYRRPKLRPRSARVADLER